MPPHNESQEETSGSGFVIRGRRILTNADVVANHTFIRVRKHGSPNMYKAEIQAIRHECDLAVLVVKSENFWEGMNSFPLGNIPCLRDAVSVVGYPQDLTSISSDRYLRRMGTPSYQVAAPEMANPSPIVVIHPQFCVPYPVDLIISRKVMTLAEGSFGVTDVKGNLMFKIKGQFFSLRDRRVLLDAAGNPVVSFQQKILTAHRRWQAFRGDSSSSKDLLFSVKKSSLLQFKTKLDVFLASNTKQDVCDFRIEGSWFERSCTIYAGTSSAVVAQMHRKHSVQSILLDKDTFSVTCYPQVDNAFIVALIVILEEINEDKSGND